MSNSDIQVKVISPVPTPGVETVRKHTSLHVAAYCRVSTDETSQQTSFSTQKTFYTRLINEHNGWTIAGIYTDEAISGTSTLKRKGFNRMMADAKAGKIDYIITKSISRFARNTVDTLNYIRRLKELNPPVGVFFEKENIDTLDATGELILTILSALAQDESRSISDNIRWAIQKKFQRGEPMVNPDRMLGYNKGTNGEWVINPEQAGIVQYIYNSYIQGISANAIAHRLNRQGIKTLRGCIWRADAVLFILRNEKYVGDCENQKTITKSYLTKEVTKNQGDLPKYYVKNHHAPIIDRYTWNMVQSMLHNNTSAVYRVPKPLAHLTPAGGSPFLSLRCACGSKLVRMRYNSTLKMNKGRYHYFYPVWRCGDKCRLGTLHELALEQSFMEALYALKADYEKSGEQSYLSIQLTEAIKRASLTGKSNSYPMERLEILEEQIREARRSNSNALNDLLHEYNLLREDYDPASHIRKSFDFFISCLKNLPTTKGMSKSKSKSSSTTRTMNMDPDMPLNIPGLDTATAPDFLPFDRGIYSAFVTKAVIYGDRAEYTTTFGVTLITTGNSRTLQDFIGYRKVTEDGTLAIVREKWMLPTVSLHRDRD